MDFLILHDSDLIPIDFATCKSTTISVTYYSLLEVMITKWWLTGFFWLIQMVSSYLVLFGLTQRTGSKDSFTYKSD